MRAGSTFLTVTLNVFFWALLAFSPATPFDPTFFMSCTVSNVICCLVFGQRFSYDDDNFLHLLQIIADTLKFGSSPRGQVRGGGAEKARWRGRWVKNTLIRAVFPLLIVLSTPHHSCIISSLNWWNGCQVHSTKRLPELRSWESLSWKRSGNTRTRWTPAHPEITSTASSLDSLRYDSTQFINQNKPLWTKSHVYSLQLLIHRCKYT